MVTPKRDTKLARTREEGRAVRAARDAAPLSFVVPPIAKVLGTIQAIAGNETARMLADQETGSRLSLDDAKKLNTLTAALVAAHGAEKELGEKELGGMSDEELRAEFLKELEKEQAK